MRENAAGKGRRLLTEARLTVNTVSTDTIEAICRGDSAEIYSLGFGHGRWWCSCAAIGRCSHLTALMLVTMISDTTDTTDTTGSTDTTPVNVVVR